MSFSGNPLGQGARLDHNSFMNKNQPRPDSPPEDSLSNSPPRRSVVPLSYAYGAPSLVKGATNQTSPNRVPSPTRSSSSSARNRSARSAANNTLETEEVDSNISNTSSSARGQEPGAVRYARLKQRNQALGEVPHHPSGPGIILSPPSGINLRDTSVNVATAFYQAAHHAMSPPPEYEKETHLNAPNNGANRRIAPPPQKSRKPPSKVVPSKPLDEISERNGRAKSPILDTMASVGQAISLMATSPTRYFLREGEPIEDVYQPLRMDERATQPPSRQNTKSSTVPSNESYDYEAEEAYMRGEGSASGSSQRSGHQKKKSVAMSAGARLSLDNKAYLPSSDDDDDDEEDGAQRKKKSKKKDDGISMTLPVIAYDKRKKKKSISQKSGVLMDDQSASGDERAPPPAETRRSTSRPPSRPPSRAGSIPRDSVPPSHPAHYQTLEEVRETEEDTSFADPDQSNDYDGNAPAPPLPAIQSDAEIRQLEAQSNARAKAHVRRRFSPGGALGKLVYFFMSAMTTILRRTIQAIAMLFFLVWTVIWGIYTILVATPLRWASACTRDLPWAGIGKVAFLLAVLVAIAAFHPASVPDVAFMRWFANRGTFPSYKAPAIPAESVQDLIARLTKVENTLADLAIKESQAHRAAQLTQNEAVTRVELLHERIENESRRAREAEEQFRAAAARGIAGVRSEFETLHAEWERIRASDVGGSDVVESLKEVQARVSGMESGLKEALEAGRASTKAVGSVGWWNKWGNDEGKLVIKSSDGQDVTGLINSFVDHAVTRLAKDGIGKPDFALYSAGGRVIPHLTSNTYEIRPSTWARYVVGAVTGSGYAMGRPPVTALHPDVHVGNCWPFAGGRGQIGLLLARPNVLVSEVTIDHAPRDVAYDIRAAPRQMELWGLVQGADNIAKVRAYQQSTRERRKETLQKAEREGFSPPEEDPYPEGLPRSPHYIRLAQFTYDVHASNHVQTFAVPKDIQEIGADFGVVVLLIKNNWGEDDFTCLYRVRIHGMDKDRRPYLLPEQDTP